MVVCRAEPGPGEPPCMGRKIGIEVQWVMGVVTRCAGREMCWYVGSKWWRCEQVSKWEDVLVVCSGVPECEQGSCEWLSVSQGST